MEMSREAVSRFAYEGNKKPSRFTVLNVVLKFNRNIKARFKELRTDGKLRPLLKKTSWTRKKKMSLRHSGQRIGNHQFRILRSSKLEAFQSRLCKSASLERKPH
jgi:hypothetical protein